VGEKTKLPETSYLCPNVSGTYQWRAVLSVRMYLPATFDLLGPGALQISHGSRDRGDGSGVGEDAHSQSWGAGAPE